MPDAATEPESARPPARKPKGRSRILIAAAAGGAMLALAGGVRYGVPVNAAPHIAANADFAVNVAGAGTLEALRKTVLATTAPGRLEDVFYGDGAHVAADETVAQLEAFAVRIDLDQAKAKARAATHRVFEAAAQLRREEVAFLHAKRELARRRSLAGEGVASDDRAFDSAQADHDAAAARFAEVMMRLERLKAERDVAMHTVARHEETLAQTVVVAPFGGVITERHREVGDVVAAGAAIYELVEPTSLALRARFDESVLARIEAGQRAAVAFDSAPDKAFEATVLRVNRQVDPETREVTVDLALGALPKNWALGQRGAAEIRVDTRASALTLPSRLVERRGDGVGVWVLEGRRAAWRALALGSASGGRVEVLSGLEAGETVLEAERLYRGALVETRG